MRQYFDNAATSFPKPPGVVEAVTRYLTEEGAAAGRGSYRAAQRIEQRVNRCRSLIARLLGVDDPRRVVFTFNGTDALNLGILGLCRPGDHVVSSTWEHNSVLRPLRQLREHRGVEVTLIEPEVSGAITPEMLSAALRPHTRLVVLQQASNVLGTIQNLEALARIVRQHGAFFLVDAAQTAGHLPIDLSALPVDLLATSGHKGLLGPLGTGVLVVGPRVEAELVPLRFGGTGTRSEDDQQPGTLPDRWESGNLNVAGLVGLEASVEWLLERGMDGVRQHEIARTAQLWDGLRQIAGVRLYGPPPDDVMPRIGVISLTVPGYEPQDASAILDEHFGIECRAGLHCAPGVHRSLGTLAGGGTLRLSVGAFTTPEAVDQAVAGIRSLAEGL